MKSVMSRREALDAGYTPKQIRERTERGRWQVPHPGVYITHPGTATWKERLAAAVLAAGEGAVAEGECAQALWDLTDREPPILTVAIPHSRRCRDKGLRGVRVRRRRRLTRTTRHGIPVTGLNQTVVDVLASPRFAPDDIMAQLVRACRPRKSSPAKLRAELAHHPRHPRRDDLLALLEAAELGLGSAAEWRYVRDVELAHGLPPMTPQVPVDGARIGPVGDGHLGPVGDERGDQAGEGPPASRDQGPRVAPQHGVQRLDFVDEERGVGVEVDGELYHRERARADRSRDRRSAGRGLVMLRAGWVDVVMTPCELAADVAVVQRERGWRGRPGPCSPTCSVVADERLWPDAAG